MLVSNKTIPCGTSKDRFEGTVSDKAKGFKYHVDRAQIANHKARPIARRLRWLLEGNKLRKSLPAKTRAIQEAFRQGKI